MHAPKYAISQSCIQEKHKHTQQFTKRTQNKTHIKIGAAVAAGLAGGLCFCFENTQFIKQTLNV